MIFLLLAACFGYSQKVAVIGINHSTPDGFSFVVTDNAGLANGEVIYFTENEYDNSTNVFNTGEGTVAFTAGSAIAKGNVVFITETATDTFSVTCTGGGCGTAAMITPAFNTGSGGDAIYAYSDSDANPANGVTTIHSVMFAGEGTTGGNIPAIMDPTVDYASAIVVDGFPATPAPDRVEFNTSAGARTNVSKVGLESISNYVYGQTNAALSTTFFTNLNLVGSNPVVTVTASPASVAENSGTGMVYTFTITPTSGTSTSVNFNVSGSALFGTDYTQSGAASFTTTTGTIIIPANTATASMTLTPTGELGVEPHESIVITLASGTGYDAGTPGAASTMINNDDSTNNEPMVALVGISHNDPDAFSFVATKDVPAGTVIYFTDKSFDNTTLLFGSGDAVLRWTSPGSTLLKGNVVVVTESAPDTFTVTCSGGTCGSIALMSGNFATASTGETMYAYTDNDADPTNGVTDVYAVLYTGGVTTGGNIPAIEDPSGIFLGALVVDGFPTSPAPARTEYDPAGRGILVTDAIFENPSNWVFAQASPALSTTPFANINVIDSTPPTAICQNISVTPVVGTGSVTITASQINNGSTDNVGVTTLSVSPDTFTCANIGTPVTVTLTVGDAAGNTSTCTATVTVLPNEAPTFTQVGPVCSGAAITLPTTSNNGISGTWSPAVDNTQTTTYTFTPTQTRCGTPVTMTVVVNPNITPTFTQVDPICSGDSFTLPTTSNNGFTGTWAPAIDNTATTTYTFTPDAGQCATTATMTVVVNPLTSNTSTVTACDTYTWAVNGTTYTVSGTYTNVNGCHTETLNLTIAPTTSNTTTVSACDSYTWAVNGTTYTTSGTYTDVNVCHTETLNLTITPSTSNTLVAAACDTYTWALNGSTYTSSGTYSVVTGCHSEILELTIDQLDVTINPYTTTCLGQLMTLSANVTASGTNYVPFNGAFAVANWTFANDPAGSGGSVNTGNAPNTISLTSGNNGSAGNANFSIVVPAGITSISFDWNYSTGDGANWDRPQVILNGVPTLMTGYDTGGANGQSGSMDVTVVPGDTFALSMRTQDGIFGSATVVISNFMASGNTPATYAWSASAGGTIVGAADEETVQVSTAGTYTLTVTNGTCSDSDSANVTFELPAGNPAVFGDNEWNVYVYNAGGSMDTGNSWNTAYSGYYTIPGISFDTQAQWCNTCSPSDAPGYQGCDVGVDNHSWSAKRQGFPSNYYSIDIPSHDDEAELWVNGVMVWEHTNCCDTHIAVWQGFLGASDTIEYRVTEGSGGSHGVISISPIVPTITAGGATTFCQGGSVVLTSSAAPGLGYLWSTGATTQSITVSASGSYTVQHTGPGGYMSAASAPTTVTVNPNPSLAVSGTTSICIGDSTTLTASGADSFAWGSTTDGTIPVDNISGTTKLAVGLRKLKTSYAGPCVRLRRDSDNTEMDFGFAGNDLDKAAITTWLNGATGYCVRLYDQSGRSKALR